MRQRAPALAIADNAAASLAECRQEILAGLTAAQKRLAPKYLYDERGSQLFDEICSLPEYYPTRTELGLLRTHAAAIAELAGPRAEVVELGAGSSLKARLLLDCLDGARQLYARRHLGRPTSRSRPRRSPPRFRAWRCIPCSPISRVRSRCRGDSRASGRSCFSPARRSATSRAFVPPRCSPRSPSARRRRALDRRRHLP